MKRSLPISHEGETAITHPWAYCQASVFFVLNYREKQRTWQSSELMNSMKGQIHGQCSSDTWTWRLGSKKSKGLRSQGIHSSGPSIFAYDKEGEKAALTMNFERNSSGICCRGWPSTSTLIHKSCLTPGRSHRKQAGRQSQPEGKPYLCNSIEL